MSAEQLNPEMRAGIYMARSVLKINPDVTALERYWSLSRGETQLGIVQPWTEVILKTPSAQDHTIIQAVSQLDISKTGEYSASYYKNGGFMGTSAHYAAITLKLGPNNSFEFRFREFFNRAYQNIIAIADGSDYLIKVVDYAAGEEFIFQGADINDLSGYPIPHGQFPQMYYNSPKPVVTFADIPQFQRLDWVPSFK